ncbi:corepressor interacting with RBPJ 1 [Anopheles maculipalpis]|uniref:corepressor interacting with RBPJ 1 n=1 Tax=Anopheles maculipalpis TaxID=1496333 RepID=UPI002158F3AF|nr:corepressor interacting with RBPJ 1 [Anopheles maculipalpis]
MGKGFNNYMCKKFFHPASRDNLKRVWMAEQQAEAYKKKQEELRNQYEKEQELHDNKAMLSRDSKDKLSVNFMYELPPGMKKEREQESNESEYKFEWQRKYNAPRESYCKGDTEIRDQPFGIQVRNVRCIKCHKWGHINTDKECTMYSLSMSEAKKIHSEAEANQILSKGELEQQLRDDGLAMKRSAQELVTSHKLVADPEVEQAVPETEFIRSLTKKQKKKLLKKLEKIEKRQRSSKKKGKKRTSRSSSGSSNSSDSSSSSDSEADSRTLKKKAKKSNHHHHRSDDRNGERKERERGNERRDKHRHHRSRSRSPHAGSSRSHDATKHSKRRDRSDSPPKRDRSGRR